MSEETVAGNRLSGIGCPGIGCRESVVAVTVRNAPGKVPLCPLAGAVKETVTPWMGLLPESLTRATNCVAKSVPTTVLWELPAVTVRLAGEPVRFVRLKLATDPPTKAVGPKLPMVPLAVRVPAAVAMPAALVIAVEVWEGPG